MSSVHETVEMMLQAACREGGPLSDLLDAAADGLLEEHRQRITLQHHAADLVQRIADLIAERDKLAARLAEIESQPPVAWVPVHPRTGRLWAMTTATPCAERQPQHYPQEPLYARQAPAAEPTCGT